MNKEKIFIYQVLPRLLGNTNDYNKKNGSIEENGSGKFNDISSVFLNKLKQDGYTHIWLIGILAHASATDYTSFGIPKEYPEIIKGKAGSPYAVRDYYDVDPDLSVDVNNRMGEFEDLIERIHNANMKVIIDFIPNHLARNYNSTKNISSFGVNDNINVSFSPNNNFYYIPDKYLELSFLDKDSNADMYQEFPAKATGNDVFTNKPSIYDWYETVKLNYGVDYLGAGVKYFDPIPDTWIKMRDILVYWSQKKVDGFRCDMAEMVPIEFWEWVIQDIKSKYPKLLFIAEIYNPELYRVFLGENVFDYLYDKVGVYDVIRAVACGQRPSSDISFALNNVGDIQDKMVNFLENHDEQRIASDFFLGNASKSKASMILSACIHTNPIMVYFGQELGERGMDEEGFSGKDGRTTIFDYWSIDTIRRWNNNGKWDEELLYDDEKDLKGFYSKLITLCNKEKSISEGLFYDLMPSNYDNDRFDSTKQFAFLRGNNEDVTLIVVNFDNKPVDILVEIPDHAYDFFNLCKSSKYSIFPLLFNTTEASILYKLEPINVSIKENHGEVYKVSAL